MIVYTNTAELSEKSKEQIDYYLNTNPSLKGYIILIHGRMYSDVKFMSTVKFTQKEDDPQKLIDNNKFYDCHSKLYWKWS